MVEFLIEGLEALTKWSLVSWWLHISYMIDHIRVLSIDSSSISSPLALICWQIEPNHSINTTLNHGLWWGFLGSWLHKKQCLLKLLISLDWIELWVWFVPTERLFKKFGLSIAAREVNKYPSFHILILEVLDLFSKLISL